MLQGNLTSVRGYRHMSGTNPGLRQVEAMTAVVIDAFGYRPLTTEHA